MTSVRWRVIVTPSRCTSRSGRSGQPERPAEELADEVGPRGEREREPTREARVHLEQPHVVACVVDEALDVAGTLEAERCRSRRGRAPPRGRPRTSCPSC